MKMRNRRTALCIVALLLFWSVGLYALPPLDIGFEGLFTNLDIPWTKESPISDDHFPWDYWGFGGQAYVQGAFSEDFSFRIAAVSDPVMRNFISTMVLYETGFARIGVGPIIGVLNTAETPVKSGISANIRMEWPGLAFVTVKADASIGAALFAKGDYLQEMGEIAAGFYVYNAICSLSIGTKKFYSQISDDKTTLDSQVRYSFIVDVHKKGAPYNVLTLLGYQSLSKTYGDGSTDELGSLLLGARIGANVSRTIKLVSELESSVYTFGLQGLEGKSPELSSFLFSARLGLVISLDSTSNAPRQAVEEQNEAAPAEESSEAEDVESK